LYFKNGKYLKPYIRGIDKYVYRKVCINGEYKEIKLLLANNKNILEKAIIVKGIDNIMFCGGIK
jgi:hypothetical protein